MSTRSLICKKIDKDKYQTIYCHSDGYLTFNGAMLLDHYQDEEKLDKLLALGDISCLAPIVDPDPTKPHSFDYNERQDDVVVAYGRDRGDKGAESKLFNFEELTDTNSWIEYVYIFTEDKTWIYAEVPFREFNPLQEGVDDEYKKMGIKRPKDYYGFWCEETINAEKKRQEQEEM